MKYLLFFCLVLFSGSSAADDGVPSDFSTSVGNALLCLDKIDPGYFDSYLQSFFGPPYKTVGDKKWYRVDKKLWGKEQLTDVIVGSNPPLLAAIIDDEPEATAEAIFKSTGIKYTFEGSHGTSPEFGGIVAYQGSTEVFCLQN
ncbi:MAG TPA: hypothetical protein PLK99_13385 [Burkholderiales bacterium]|nr:hypothetical protein [Burkholderiales bacterium]